MIDFIKKVLLGTFGMAPKFAVYLILAGTCCAYSERLNGRNVQTELAGDWILVPAIILGVLGVASIAASVYFGIQEEKERKARTAQNDQILKS